MGFCIINSCHITETDDLTLHIKLCTEVEASGVQPPYVWVSMSPMHWLFLTYYANGTLLQKNLDGSATVCSSPILTCMCL